MENRFQQHIISSKDLNESRSNKISNMVFSNFSFLDKYPHLNHNIKEINKIINSTTSHTLLYTLDGSIVAYVMCDIMNLKDGRKVLYIDYIFVVPQFRHAGIGKKMLTYTFNTAKQNNLSGVMLTSDSQDQYVYNWYLDYGFMPDVLLRTYNRHEILYKAL